MIISILARPPIRPAVIWPNGVRPNDMRSNGVRPNDQAPVADLIINVKSLDVNTVNLFSFPVAEQGVENLECFHYLGSRIAVDGGPRST